MRLKGFVLVEMPSDKSPSQSIGGEWGGEWGAEKAKMGDGVEIEAAFEMERQRGASRELAHVKRFGRAAKFRELQ